MITRRIEPGVIVYDFKNRDPGNPPEDVEPVAFPVKRKLETMIKRMYEELENPAKQKQIAAAACAGLATGTLYLLATGGTLGPVAAVQATICTIVVYAAVETIKSRQD
ncbi:hypothetical protein LAG90_12280 [Marinilongibacter aquaticus]|uniref:hypothetical protein n=1 Tax=Marinilongibacter aquaticus TaxID=2975157 RepID=UPI0021BDB696|nr:hypothetical protein [Marinilongibacter aquaticus]UBM57593.1 hypothetical protein LAG90_12280 [Marinilongibacter aquaticus]